MLQLIKKLFGPQGRTRRKVPILGVQASGKSSLIITIAQYVSLHKLGTIPLQYAAYFAQAIKEVAEGRQRATHGVHPFEVEVTAVETPAGHRQDVDLLLSSNDISGAEFSLLVDGLREDPDLSSESNTPARRVLSQFAKLLTNCDGFVFVVDLLGGTDAPQDGRQLDTDVIWQAYANQVQPIMTAILLANQLNATLSHKPMFFVFSKPDLHLLPSERVQDDFERALAIVLAPLRNMMVNIRYYDVRCAGWKLDSALNDLGVDILLYDLAHALGAAEISGP